MFEADPIEADAPHLHSESRVFHNSLVQILKDLFLNKKLLNYLLLQSRVRVPCLNLLSRQFRNFKRSLKSSDGHREWVKRHKLALMTDVAA